MTEPARSTLKGAALALSAFALFATHDVIVKFLGGHYTPFQIIFYSVLLSFPLVVLMLIGDAEKSTLRPIHPWWSAIRVIAIIISASCGFFAFATIPLAQVYPILFAAPLLITVLSIPILGERVGPHRWGAVIVGLVGVLVVIRPGSAELGLGHFAAIASAMFSALASIIVRKVGREERNAVLLVYPMLGNFLAMGALMPFVYVPMPFEHLAAVAVLATLAFVAGLLIIQAYKTADAAVVAPMQYSQIIWAAIFGWAIFKEAADGVTWIGAAIIIASGLYIVVRESLAGNSRTTPVLKTQTPRMTGYVPKVSGVEKAAPAN